MGGCSRAIAPIIRLPRVQLRANLILTSVTDTLGASERRGAPDKRRQPWRENPVGSGSNKRLAGAASGLPGAGAASGVPRP
jgi:hypothetical protein